MKIEESLQVEDKTFSIYITSEEIQRKVKICAEKLNAKFEGSNNIPIILSLLNGATFFTVDLTKHTTFLSKVDYVKYVSYDGTERKESITDLIGLKGNLAGEDVILIDDIIDSGHTMSNVVDIVKAHNPKSITVVTCILKSRSLKCKLNVDFYAIEMLDDPFIVGYGLDYNEVGRTLKDIYILD